ncbi:glutathione S-transferase family protein [Caulobacter sp. BP25]|uniref:glutathione S-transferase family protein n=1 Tax=Caulobacter sp. BP25 TaxID=2048900 RepID=UPI000C12E048|nr:glutathione S-transferase family protein [Caulobacter sp. BP25]PHY17234.1 glutathione S-transferase [Caulobacter sp. BP25]
MTPVVSAYNWVPDIARGKVRDLRARWALEEIGSSYATETVLHQDKSAYLAKQPFGQVPAYDDGEIALFESGAIVLHIAQGQPALMPSDPQGRARTISWMFCALNTLEIPISFLAELNVFSAGQAWTEGARPRAEGWVRQRLAQLAARLGENAYLDGERFTAGDLLVADVLRNAPEAMLAERPNLADYLARCTARPAFQKAMAAQLADLNGTPPPGWG